MPTFPASLTLIIVLAVLYLLVGKKRLDDKDYTEIEMTDTYKKISSLCFYSSITCIAIGLLLSLAMVWGIFGKDNDIVEKGWLSVAIIFIATIFVAVVNHSFALRPPKTKIQSDDLKKE